MFSGRNILYFIGAIALAILIMGFTFDKNSKKLHLDDTGKKTRISIRAGNVGVKI
jgi:hypothetical protein